MRSLPGVRAHLRPDMGAARQVGVLGTPLMRGSEDVAEGEGAVKRPRRELRGAEEPHYGRSYLLLENPGLQLWPCDVFGHRHRAVVVMCRRVGPTLGPTGCAQRSGTRSQAPWLRRHTPTAALEVVTADLGVRGSRVQISPARQAKHLVSAGLDASEQQSEPRLRHLTARLTARDHLRCERRP